MRPRTIPHDSTFDDISSEMHYDDMLCTSTGPMCVHLQATATIQVAHSRDENGTEYFEHKDDDLFFLMCPSNFENIGPPPPILSDVLMKGKTLPVAAPSSNTPKPRRPMPIISGMSRELRNTRLSLQPRLCRHPPSFE